MYRNLKTLEETEEEKKERENKVKFAPQFN